MSFYGNVAYYLSNAFSKAVYRNANNGVLNDDVTTPIGTTAPSNTEVSYEYILSPRNRSDNMILETGNKWLMFGDPDGTQSNNQIKIFHTLSAAGAASETPVTPVVTDSDAIDENITPLNFKSIITLPTIAFDQAGHISTVGSAQYQLAEPPGAQDIESFREELSTLEEHVEEELTRLDGDIQNNDEIYAEITRKLTEQVSDWDMQSSGDAYNSLKEANGIGTVLHDALVQLGLRQRHANAYDSKDGYETISQSVAESNPSCIIGKTYMAYNSAQNASSVAAGNRLGIRALLDMLVASHAIEASDRDSLKSQYFIVSGDVMPENG